ncbi:hypothetical protein SCP_1103320 [Sparassis crispa]|uniref:ribonuclease Z n=1 Tax=Sparassis crispa TaxID=139825 RepID=A0A401GZQ9_9APHY|nr:hypothetical protein SCP_1103320 [Sparassis crispa]GBE87655.1 hypothetical protein SCP_1103320 [Sparassis crispa]
MDWFVSVNSSISSDTEPTLVVTFEDAKYIFNVGENTSRKWLQSQRHWRKAKAIWLTSTGTQRGSGLSGLLMFLADAGIERLDIGGPQGLLHYLASMNKYLHRENISVNPIEIASSPLMPVPVDPAPIYKDTNITLYGVPFYPRPSDFGAPETPIPVSDSATEHRWSEGSKRKRSLSPPSSSKRHLASAAMGTTSILEKITLPGFSPTLLGGEEAQTWRKSIIRRMFQLEKPEVACAGSKSPKKINGKKGQGQNATAEVNPLSNSFHSPRLIQAVDASKGRQLPSFCYASDSGVTHSPRPVMGYVIVGPRTRGKFDVEKANALGLGNGPLRGKLTKGQTVTFDTKDDSGNMVTRTVRPEDCIGPSEIPKAMILLDIPDPSYIPSVMASFTESPFYAKLHSKSQKDMEEYLVHLVVHICGDGVLEDTKYQAFMNGFSDETFHLVASQAYSPDEITFRGAAYNQLRLNVLDPGMFPKLQSQPEPERSLASLTGLPSKTSLLRADQIIHFRPLRPPEHDKIARPTERLDVALATPTEEIVPANVAQGFSEVRSRVKALSDDRKRPQRPGDDVVVVPLGTSSATPTLLRNVSSILIEIPGYGNIMLDAGEGTWSQLARLYGNQDRSCGVWQVLRDLKCIFLSHMHADHHVGLAKILAMRKLLHPPPAQPLYLVGLRDHYNYLQAQSEIEDLGLKDANGVIMVPSDALHWRRLPHFDRSGDLPIDTQAARAAAEDMRNALGLESFATVDVAHQTKAYGVVIKHKDGWSIVFSGDTLPTNNLVRAGQGATLLIHEATLGDDEAEMARDKAHTTTGQAIDIGKMMNAENILLTHFSARYHMLLPPTPDTQRHAQSPVIAMASDHSRVRIGDMWKLNTYLPAMEANTTDVQAMMYQEQPPSESS